MKKTSKTLIQKEKALLTGVAQAIGSTLGAAVAKIDSAAKHSNFITLPKSGAAKIKINGSKKTLGARGRNRG